ncbi:MAG TPA: type II toxin-antitoxin system death-on-curing family toxin [Fibrobacteria bacterium]|nr:type II toxin-antitoxin system death-on-curing family toxin [Fibrobacteria bacterium]
MMEGEPEFLEVEDVLALHQRQLKRFGGSDGLRDRGLLESAVAQPQSSFGGVFAHEGLIAMAAAYLFHIVSNHAFVDGNKRAGLLSALTFLHINGIKIADQSEALYSLTLGVAEGRMDKAAVTLELERIVELRSN